MTKQLSFPVESLAQVGANSLVGNNTGSTADGRALSVAEVVAMLGITDGVDGQDGAGWISGSYNASTGVVTFSSSDGLGFSTGDLRGQDGADGEAASQAFADITGKPTTLAGYGITDAATSAQGAKADSAVQPAAITDAGTKTTPVSGDKILLINSEDSDALATVSWSTLEAAFGGGGASSPLTLTSGGIAETPLTIDPVAGQTAPLAVIGDLQIFNNQRILVGGEDAATLQRAWIGVDYLAGFNGLDFESASRVVLQTGGVRRFLFHYDRFECRAGRITSQDQPATPLTVSGGDSGVNGGGNLTLRGGDTTQATADGGDLILRGGSASGSGSSGAILILDIPTSDPLVANQLWNDLGSLKISAG